MNTDRRDFLRGGALAAAGLFAAGGRAGADPQHEHGGRREAAPTPPTPGSYRPVEAPDLGKVPYTLEHGVKVFRLTCDVVKSRFLPWREPFNTWGFNGSTPGSTIEVVEGDRVRFLVENRLPEPTSFHWHGLEVPPEMDGPPGLAQDPIPPGGTFVYEFTLHQNGTFFYHSHMAMQEMMGMVGLFVVHPRTPHLPPVDRDFGLIFQGWAILPNNPTPNTLAMEFNWLTINGKAGPATTPMLVRQGERVRLRLVNLGMDHHPIHIHGNTWAVTGTEGGRIPRSAWVPGNTVLLGVAQARDVEFEARYAGDWMLHCHLPHHMMNHMASMVGPISRVGGGLPTGRSMESGMGMLHGGAATDEGFGPSMGRALGAGDAEQAVTNLPLGEGSGHGGHGEHWPVAPNAREVPGYPQDMFMVTDGWFSQKPECWGLRPGWSGGHMGMMTMVRVLEPEMFDRIMGFKARQEADPDFRLPSPLPGTGVHDHGGGAS